MRGGGGTVLLPDQTDDAAHNVPAGQLLRVRVDEPLADTPDDGEQLVNRRVLDRPDYVLNKRCSCEGDISRSHNLSVSSATAPRGESSPSPQTQHKRLDETRTRVCFLNVS